MAVRTRPRRRAAFLDKDGTLLTDVSYNVEPSRMEFARGAADGLRLLHGAGYLLIVVSNQSGVARGYFGEEDVRRAGRHLSAMLESSGVPLTGFYYCPHLETGCVQRYAVRCGCRKPQPGLIRRAAAEHDVDVASSWMIGDILDDVEAGNRAGCRTVLVDAGGETEWQPGAARVPDYVTGDLHAAASTIVRTGSELHSDTNWRAV